ncbi:MAG: hypothetical protein EOP51_27020 [Sphingobacteriales bacterium]|nr:MAG: hypothetical protein EOP51_27020 [Sphingobacteriales bacterium]
MQNKQTVTIQRLTALWALGESGLGGWMHALKLPFTGIFVGGFAVACIALIAHYCRNNMRIMLQALLLVLLVKFTVSPQSPLPAYFAVAFQGVIGAIFYRLISNYTVASVLFAFIAMLESGAQKIIIMTLIFGKSLWEAIDAFFGGILKDFSLPQDMPFSYWVIGLCMGLYAVWGLVLGAWLSGLPKRLELRSAGIIEEYKRLAPASNESTPAQPRTKRRIKWFMPLVFAFIILIFLFSDNINSFNKAGYLVLRTVAVVLFLFYVLSPALRWLMVRWLNNRKAEQSEALRSILMLQPELRQLLKPSWQMSKAKHQGLRRYPAFVTNMITLTLHPIE